MLSLFSSSETLLLYRYRGILWLLSSCRRMRL